MASAGAFAFAGGRANLAKFRVFTVWCSKWDWNSDLLSTIFLYSVVSRVFYVSTVENVYVLLTGLCLKQLMSYESKRLINTYVRTIITKCCLRSGRTNQPEEKHGVQPARSNASRIPDTLL